MRDYMLPWKAARNALESVLEVVPGESAVIICDDEKADVGQAFSKGSLACGLWTRLLVMKTGREARKEIPKYVLEVLASKPSLYINLLRGIGDETPFRIKLIGLETRDKKSRLGHCPGVNMRMLTDGALSLTGKQHRDMQDFAAKLIQRLRETVTVSVTSPAGTDISFKAEGRVFYTDTRVDWKNMKWMNLPTGEVIVAPVEDSLEGTLVCDMAVGGLGPLKSPIEISVEEGAVVRTSSQSEEELRRVRSALDVDDWAKVVGEFAFGINPSAKSLEEFLEAEKIEGTVHFAFGNNTDMPGGKNPSRNHTDFLVSKPAVEVAGKDGVRMTVLRDGAFQN
jgi:hypothetical protein